MQISKHIASFLQEARQNINVWFITGAKPPFERKPYGYLFGLKPGERIKWTYADFKMVRNLFIFVGGIYLWTYKPTDSLDMWAHKQALQRMIRRGIAIDEIKEDLSLLYSMDIDELIRLWNEYGYKPNASYIVEYPIEGLNRIDLAEIVFYDIPRIFKNILHWN